MNKVIEEPSLAKSQVALIPSRYASSNRKRVFDITVALAGLVATGVFLPFIYLANWLCCPGSLFFSQIRKGKDGELFTLRKFRTMDDETPRQDVPDLKRITPVGKVLRKFHIDEFPQAWNVLSGEMSIVGPRPYVEQECVDLSKECIGFDQRHLVRPGITGLAQIHYDHSNSGRSARRKLAMDRIYVEKSSFLIDVVVLWKTLRLALKSRGV